PSPLALSPLRGEGEADRTTEVFAAIHRKRRGTRRSHSPTRDDCRNSGPYSAFAKTFPISCGFREAASRGGRAYSESEKWRDSNSQSQRLPSAARLVTQPQTRLTATQSERVPSRVA